MFITAEQIDAWEKELDKQDNLLLEHSWEKVENGWKSPDGVFHSHDCAYDHLIDRLLLEQGWKRVTLCSEVTFGFRAGRIDKTARRQSPYTGRVYNFLEAMAIYEGWLLENEFPLKFNKFSVAINQALPNFKGDVIHVFYTKEEGRLFLRLKDGEILYELL
jgi:hypothetical protein